MTSKKTLVVVPTYNECDNIEALLDAIHSASAESDVLVVDDNSPDGTARLVEDRMATRPSIHLLRRPGKQGLGAAYKAGFQWGLDQGYDFLIQMDADFSHPPSALPVMVETLSRSPVVTGSRYVPRGSVSGWGVSRKIISRGGNLYARSVLGMRTHDVTGGFNGWRREVLEAIHFSDISSKGYVFQIELKYRALLKGYSIAEIPIHFENRRLGASKMSGSIFWEAAVHVLKLRSTGRQFCP
jgi:dolichol-phosphate mannosyltransferase